MNVVYKQSVLNTLVLFLGFAIGGINVLFLYTHFLDAEYYGLITFLLSTATIFLPFLIFGMHNTVVKFFSAYQSDKEKDGFLIASLLLPLVLIIPAFIIGYFAYDYISDFISKTNPIIKKYTVLIFLVAVFMGYFELFYAWSKVQMQSVFGNFIKEVFARITTSALLILVYFDKLTNAQFIYAIVIVYGVRVFIMLFYALYLYRPKWVFKLPDNLKEVLRYSGFIIVAGSAGFILLEIDKYMIPQIKEGMEQVAFYSVGIYIASVVGIPARAMQQIATPITAKELNNNDIKAVENLYKSSSVNQLIAGGLLFLLINLNVQDLYIIIDKPEYTGIMVVMLISIAKLFELLMGTNTAILSNSKYYKTFFYISIAMALSVFFMNKWLINLYGNTGAALATLIVFVVFVIIKVGFVYAKYKIHPFTKKTLQIIVLVGLLFIVFKMFKMRFNPFINIVLRSVILGIFYLILSYKLKLSKGFNIFMNNYLNRKNG